MTNAATRFWRTESVSIAVSSVVLVCCGVFFLPTWQALAARWSALSETNSHGFLIVLISVYLILFKTRIRRVESTGSQRLVWMAVLLVLAFVWQIANMANVLLLQAIALPLIILLSYFSIFGRRCSRDYVFPALFLYFATPLWSGLIPALQKMSVVVVSWFLSITSIPAFIDGEIVHVSNGSFRIESGCSGLNFLVVGLALATLCGRLFLTNVIRRIYLVLIVAVLAIVANWIRIATIVFVGERSEMQHYLVAVDHYYFGWVVFIVAMIPFYIALQKFEKLEPVNGEQYLDTRKIKDSVPGWQRRLLMVCGVLCVFPVLGISLDAASSRNAKGEIDMPRVLGEWAWLEGESNDWIPRYPGARTEQRGRYRRGDDDIRVYANLYTAQKNGEELIGRSSGVVSLPTVVEQNRLVLEYVNRNSVDRDVLHSVGIRPDGNRQVFIYWYFVGDERFSSSKDVKISELIARIKGETGSGVIALMMNCRDDCQAEQFTLLEFLAEYDSSLRYVAANSRQDWSNV